MGYTLLLRAKQNCVESVLEYVNANITNAVLKVRVYSCRSSHSQVFLKFCNIHRKAPVLESLFNKVEGLRACNFIKKDSNTGVFL